MAKADPMLLLYQELVDYCQPLQAFIDKDVTPEVWVRRGLKSAEPTTKFTYSDDGKGLVQVKSLTTTDKALKHVERLANNIYNEHPAELAEMARAKMAARSEELAKLPPAERKRLDTLREAFPRPEDKECEPTASDMVDASIGETVESESLPSDPVTSASVEELRLDESSVSFAGDSTLSAEEISTLDSGNASVASGPSSTNATGTATPAMGTVSLSEDQKQWLTFQSLDYHEYLATLTEAEQLQTVEADMMVTSESAEAVEGTAALTDTLAEVAEVTESLTQTEANSELQLPAPIDLPSQEEIRRMMIADGLLYADEPLESGVSRMLGNFDERAAGWVVAKKRENHHKIDDLKAQFLSMVAEPLRRLERLSEIFDGHLREFALARIPRHTTNTKTHKAGDLKHKNYKMPEGTVFFRKQGGWKVVNESKVREYLNEAVGDLTPFIDEELVRDFGIKVKIDFSRTKVKELAASGEVIPGVEFELEHEAGKISVGVGSAWSFESVKKEFGKAVKLLSLKGEESEECIDIDATMISED